VNTVFTYDAIHDVMRYSGRSLVYGRIMEMRGWTQARLEEEINERIHILEAMQEQKITDYRKVSHIFHLYAINRNTVMESIETLSRLFS